MEQFLTVTNFISLVIGLSIMFVIDTLFKRKAYSVIKKKYVNSENSEQFELFFNHSLMSMDIGDQARSYDSRFNILRQVCSEEEIEDIKTIVKSDEKYSYLFMSLYIVILVLVNIL